MASKSGHLDADKGAEVEEMLDNVESLLDRVKVLYEQYFLGIQKQAPAHLHHDIDRKMRDLAQVNIRNTAMRYRLATVQQKFGSYNTYWRRTLRQIENGTYVRSLSRIGRQAARTGDAIPEEILAAMPKRMREQVARDRQVALAQQQRRGPGAPGEVAGGSSTSMGKVSEDFELDIEEAALEDVATIYSKPPPKVHRIEEDDVDVDALFAAITDDAADVAVVQSRPPPGAKPRATTDVGFGGGVRPAARQGLPSESSMEGVRRQVAPRQPTLQGPGPATGGTMISASAAMMAGESISAGAVAAGAMSAGSTMTGLGVGAVSGSSGGGSSGGGSSGAPAMPRPSAYELEPSAATRPVAPATRPVAPAAPAPMPRVATQQLPTQRPSARTMSAVSASPPVGPATAPGMAVFPAPPPTTIPTIPTTPTTQPMHAAAPPRPQMPPRPAAPEGRPATARLPVQPPAAPASRTAPLPVATAPPRTATPPPLGPPPRTAPLPAAGPPPRAVAPAGASSAPSSGPAAPGPLAPRTSPMPAVSPPRIRPPSGVPPLGVLPPRPADPGAPPRPASPAVAAGPPRPPPIPAIPRPKPKP